ncbi:MAG: 5-formyltetrahydrofolate cyclo-ligase [Promethearchaeota archaeon]
MESEIPKDPVTLRKYILEKRKNLSETERTLRFNKILNQFYEIPRYKRSKHLLAYYGILRNAEFDTLGLMEKILQDGKHLYLTRCIPNQIQLEIYEIHDPINDLEPGMFKIMEPKTDLEKLNDFEKLDIIIVPGLVYDCWGMRYGYGKGYYDSLLGKQSVNNALKISFALSFSVMDFKLKSHELDVPMDMIITENEKIIMKSKLV